MNKSRIFVSLMIVASLGVAAVAFADPSPVPSAVAQLQADASAASVSDGTVIGDAVLAVKSLGSFNVFLKAALILLLIDLLLKVPALQSFWAKFGAMESWLPNVLLLVSGALVIAGVQGFSAGSVLGYLSSGAGAALLALVLTSIINYVSPNSVIGSILAAVKGALSSSSKS